MVVEQGGVDAPRVGEFECFEVGFEGVAEEDGGGGGCRGGCWGFGFGSGG